MRCGSKWLFDFVQRTIGSNVQNKVGRLQNYTFYCWHQIKNVRCQHVANNGRFLYYFKQKLIHPKSNNATPRKAWHCVVYFFCCCDFSKDILLNQVYETSTTKKQIKESILSTQANSWNSVLVLNFTTIFCWIAGLFAVIYTSQLMFDEIPIIGLLDLFGTLAISVCAALTVYFLINTYMWIVHFEFKYLIANVAFFVFAMGLGITIIYVFQQKGSNPDGFNGIPLHFDKNNTVISSSKF